MRLWHKALISELPTGMLLTLWRECRSIAKNISMLGTPNDILVDPIMEYPISHFYNYSLMVVDELRKRGLSTSTIIWGKFIHCLEDIDKNYEMPVSYGTLFWNWHTDKYLGQCGAILEEKYDRGGLTDEEWERINDLLILYV